MADGERSEKKLVADGIEWVRERREQLGWSQAKLAIRATKMKGYLAEICPAPTAADIAIFETGELRQLPRWLKLVHYAFEFVSVPPEERCAWVNRKNWYTAGHPIDLCRPLLFRDEFRFIEALYMLSENDRRAWRAFIRDYACRRGARDRARAARDCFRRLEIPATALTDEEQMLMRAFRSMSTAEQVELVKAAERIISGRD